MDRIGSAFAVFAHDVDLRPILANLRAAGIRVCAESESDAVHLVRYGESIGVIPEPDSLPIAFLPVAFEPTAAMTAIRTAAELRDRRRAAAEARELLELARLFKNVHDRAELCAAIVRKARQLTCADAATLFEIVQPPEGPKQLRFAVAETGASHDRAYAGYTVPLDESSIAGHVALHATPIRLADVYRESIGYGLHFDRTFDESHDYRTKSMIAVPLTDAGGTAIGVLQVMNRKPSFEMPLLERNIAEIAVEPFTEHDEAIVVAMASYAGLVLHMVQVLGKDPAAKAP